MAEGDGVSGDDGVPAADVAGSYPVERDSDDGVSGAADVAGSYPVERDSVDEDSAVLRVYTDTLEGEPQTSTDVQETEETLPDGTVRCARKLPISLRGCTRP